MWEKSLVLAFCWFDEYVCDTRRKPPLLLCIHCYMRSRCMQLLWSWSHICDLIWEFLLICVVRKLVFSSVLIWLFVYASAFNCLLPQSHLICHKPYFNLKEFLFFFIVFSKQSHPLSLELLGNAYLCKKLHYFFVCMKFGKILTFSWFCCNIRSKQSNIFPLFSDKRQRWPPLSQAGWCLFFLLLDVLPLFSTSGPRERWFVFFLAFVFVFAFVWAFIVVLAFVSYLSCSCSQHLVGEKGVKSFFCLCHVFVLFFSVD